MSYLHTIKRLRNFWGVFHFEEGAQVSRGVEQLYLKTFVAERHLTADKVELCIKSLLFTHVVGNKHRGKTIDQLFHVMCNLQWIHIKRTRIKYLIILIQLNLLNIHLGWMMNVDLGPSMSLCCIVSFTITSLAVYRKIDFIIMQLCDWALLAITLAEIINAPITEFLLSWLQQVQK